jgi:hypothetical protein
MLQKKCIRLKLRQVVMQDNLKKELLDLMPLLVEMMYKM